MSAGWRCTAVVKQWRCAMVARSAWGQGKGGIKKKRPKKIVKNSSIVINTRRTAMYVHAPALEVGKFLGEMPGLRHVARDGDGAGLPELALEPVGLEIVQHVHGPGAEVGRHVALHQPRAGPQVHPAPAATPQRPGTQARRPAPDAVPFKQHLCGETRGMQQWSRYAGARNRLQNSDRRFVPARVGVRGFGDDGHTAPRRSRQHRAWAGPGFRRGPHHVGGLPSGGVGGGNRDGNGTANDTAANHDR